MIFGGFQPLSLSDFPGHVAAILFAQGCNFRCPFCHNRALLPMQAPACFDENTALMLLAQHKKLLDGVVFSGGEPTLQPDIVSVMRQVRQLGLRIKLDTNGSRPDVLRQLLAERLLDYIAMDIKAPWEKYRQLAGVGCRLEDIQASIMLLLQSGVPHEFRTTLFPPLLGADDSAAIRRLLPDGVIYKIQAFVPPQRAEKAKAFALQEDVR